MFFIHVSKAFAEINTNTTWLSHNLLKNVAADVITFCCFIDLAISALKEIGADAAADDAFKDGILSDFSFWGVDAVDGSTVTLAGQIQCRDSARWPVQREFNRRILNEFTARGIEIANPQRNFVIVNGGEPPVQDEAQTSAEQRAEPSKARSIRRRKRRRSARRAHEHRRALELAAAALESEPLVERFERFGIGRVAIGSGARGSSLFGSSGRGTSVSNTRCTSASPTRRSMAMRACPR